MEANLAMDIDPPPLPLSPHKNPLDDDAEEEPESIDYSMYKTPVNDDSTFPAASAPLQEPSVQPMEHFQPPTVEPTVPLPVDEQPVRLPLPAPDEQLVAQPIVGDARKHADEHTFAPLKLITYEHDGFHLLFTDGREDRTKDINEVLRHEISKNVRTKMRANFQKRCNPTAKYVYVGKVRFQKEAFYTLLGIRSDTHLCQCRLETESAKEDRRLAKSKPGASSRS
jgi:hypothetical protein